LSVVIINDISNKLVYHSKILVNSKVYSDIFIIISCHKIVLPCVCTVILIDPLGTQLKYLFEVNNLKRVEVGNFYALGYFLVAYRHSWDWNVGVQQFCLL